MEIIELAELNNHQKEQIHSIWNNEYSAKIAHKSVSELDKYLSGVSDHKHLILSDNEKLVGWYFQFIRDNETWFAMILDRTIHGKGYGSKLLSLAKQSSEELNGWVIDHNNEPRLDGSTYFSPLEFYKKNGFTVLEDVRLEVEVISAVKIRWRKS